MKGQLVQIVRIGDGSKTLHVAEEIGGKAANLMRIAAIGLPVPPAFVIPVGASRHLSPALAEGIEFLERATGLRFGDRRRPLLVSVRSGAARSMPGMLDTVLDVGCTPAAARGLIRMTGNPRFAWDCRRRFLEGYAQTVLGLDAEPFAAALASIAASEGAASERELCGEALERLAGRYQGLIEEQDAGLPDDAMAQLAAAVRAVHRSWMSERAQTYRRLEHLESLAGTAVTVQAMVYGNRGFTSASGVAFSRDPSTGAAAPVIDVLADAQGEDVVSGRRTPEAAAQVAPAAATELHQVLTRLEREFGDVQDVEFTIEDGKLWILQTRAAKRTPRAALHFAIDFVREGLIAPAEALHRLDGLALDKLAYARIADAGEPHARGVGASGGVAVGRAAFDSAAAQRCVALGEPVVLVRPDTSTADIVGFAAAAGILTAAGGRTAHAALVARQMGKPCVVSCPGLAVDATARHARLGDAAIEEGAWLTLDGDSGAVYLGARRTALERPEAELREVAGWRAAFA